MIILGLLIVLTIIALPLGIAKGVNNAKIKKEEALIRKATLNNMKK